MSEKRRRQTAAALATSAGLHILVALLVLHGVTGGRPEPRIERPPTPIELSVVETTRQDRSPAAGAEVAPSPPARRPAPGKRPIASGGTAAPPATSRNRSKVLRCPTARSICRSTRSATAPSSAPPRDPPTRRPWRDFSCQRLRARRCPRGASRSPNCAPRPTAAPKPWRTSGRAAHPLLFDVLRNARDRLTPEATHIAESLPLGAAETTKGWARGYLRGVDEAHSGRFAPPPGSQETTGEPPGETTGGPRPDVLGGYNEAAHQAESGAEQRSAEICLGVAPNHAVVATLRRSSGNAALDRLAVESFKSAGDAQPVTPDVRPALACYRVAVSAFRMPPLPSVGIDLVKGRIIYPLKRITRVTVELQSVDFGAKREPPASWMCGRGERAVVAGEANRKLVTGRVQAHH